MVRHLRERVTRFDVDGTAESETWCADDWLRPPPCPALVAALNRHVYPISAAPAGAHPRCRKSWRDTFRAVQQLCLSPLARSADLRDLFAQRTDRGP